MTRYPHYWWPVKGSYVPSRMAVLSCSAGTGGRDSPDTPRAGERLTWCLSRLDITKGVVERVRLSHGEGLIRLWATLATLASSKRCCWVWCERCIDVLTLIGFWDRLERRAVCLAGRDWTAPRLATRSGEGRTDALCVLQNPPTLVACQLRDQPGTITWLDTRNLGWDDTSREMSNADRVSWYSSGLDDCLSTLRQSGPLSLRCTAASQAVQSLRSSRDCRCLHCHTDRRALALERAALYGGRVEVYHHGAITGPIYHLDVRSMYPALCLTLPVPTSLRSYYDERQCQSEIELSRATNLCAHVRVRSHVPSYPSRCGGQIVYNVGEYDTTLCGPELRRAVEHGHIVRCYAAAEYNCRPALSGFYSRWLAVLGQARSRGSVLLCQWAKALMNGLPGKFCAPGRQWVPAPCRTEKGPYDEWDGTGPDGEPCRYRNVGWYTMREEVNGESYWSMPAVAAWITAAGRCQLWDYITVAGRRNIWYCDTDSLFCTRHGYNNLRHVGAIRDGAAGHLRLVATYGAGIIYGIRHYQMDTHVKCAGVPRGQIMPGETRDDYWERCPEAPVSVMGLLRGQRVRRGGIDNGDRVV